MLFAVTCTDREGALDVRVSNRSAHLDWANNPSSPIKMGGLLMDHNNQPAGSLLVIDAESEDALRDILASDPYAQADLFADVFWMPFRWTLKVPMP